MPAARLAARRSILFSPPEQGRLPSSAAITAGQSMTASGVPSLLAGVVMKRLVKSARCKNTAWPMSSSTPASSG